MEERQPARKTIEFMQDMNSTIKIMQKDIQYICDELKNNKEEHQQILKKIEDINIKISDFNNVKNLVYGAVKIILVAVGLALLGLVIIQIK
jgi:hypothetical protein